MPFVTDVLLRIKRGQTPFLRRLRSGILGLSRANLPVPGLLFPLLRFVYENYYLGVWLWRRFWAYFLWEPLFRSRCTRAGRGLRIWALPYVGGHVEIEIGENVEFAGKVDIVSGRFLEHPRLIIQDRASIGQGTLIAVNQEVLIGEDVLIAPGCRISDHDGHPRAADLRAQLAPLTPEDIRPVRICRSAWIGRDCHIMKGVTIGEGAIIGANTVVICDVPPFSVVMGNPAEVYFRNAGRPSSQAATQRASAAPQE